MRDTESRPALAPDQRQAGRGGRATNVLLILEPGGRLAQ